MPLPETLLNSLEGIKGFDRNSFTDIHDSGKQVVSIRLNPNKLLTEKAFGGMKEIPWTNLGYYLPERPSFTFDPRFHAGAYYVQEASGMFLEQAIRQHADLSLSLVALDLCAAPGGKSTHLQSLLNKESLIISNDVIQSRSNILVENLSKWGALNSIVTNNDPRDFNGLADIADIILVDAPCSGSGLFRRDPDLISEWSLSNVQLCHQRQQRIMADIYPALANEGLLVYSTCSYSKEENEDIVDWMLENFSVESLRINLDPQWGIVETNTSRDGKGYRFFSDKVNGEGFFLACFRKTDGNPRRSFQVKKQKKAGDIVDVAKLQPFVQERSGFVYHQFGDRILAQTSFLEQVLPVLQTRLYIKKAGTSMGKMSAKGLIPDHELAMTELLSGKIVDIPLKLPEALQYLRREEVILNSESSGWATVSYESLLLGWIKILPGRINNYYPQAWRILKSMSN